MLDAAQESIQILADAGGRTSTDRKLALALVKLIEIVGEAAGGVSTAGRETFDQIPWSRIIATRNRLIHGYYDIDIAVVIQTIREDFPPLVTALQTALHPSGQ